MSLQRCEGRGLSPHLVVDVPCPGAPEQTDLTSAPSLRERVLLPAPTPQTQRKVVTDPVEHMAYKAERIRRWMSR